MSASKPRISRVAAYGLIQQERRIMLCRLSPRLRDVAGHWTLPGGGVEFGEHPADAMVREVREETGLIVRPVEIAGIDSKHVERPDHAYHAVRIIYHAEVLGGELTHEIDGTTDFCAWWAMDELGALDLVDLVHATLPFARGRD